MAMLGDLNDSGERARIGEMRGLTWYKRSWHRKPALVWRNDKGHVTRMSRVWPEDLAADQQASERGEYVAGAWDHEHCSVCAGHICEEIDSGEYYSTAEAGDDSLWTEGGICPVCFRDYIEPGNVWLQHETNQTG